MKKIECKKKGGFLMEEQFNNIVDLYDKKDGRSTSIGGKQLSSKPNYQTWKSVWYISILF